MSVSQISLEVWSLAVIASGLLFGGILRKVWRPMRQIISAVDVVAGRPERYEGDEEAKPGLVKRLDDIDKAIRQTDANVTALRAELDNVKQSVENWELECPS